MKKNFVALLLLFSASVFAQYDANTPPNNRFLVGREYYPWDKAGTQSCFFYYTTNILTGKPDAYPAKNVPIASSAQVLAQSGYHIHPGDTSQRPIPLVIQTTPSNGRTDNNGCITNTWTSPNNFAGWVTFQDVPQGGNLRIGGVNNRYRYHDVGPGGSVVLLKQYNEGQGAAFNQPFQLHLDPRHNPTFPAGPDYARFGTPDSIRSMLRVSEFFYLASRRYLNYAFLPLDIIRGSLPDGGVADSEVQDGSPYSPYLMSPWNFRPRELHQLGVEWDIRNPTLDVPGNITIRFLDAILYDMGCLTGAEDQFGNDLGADPATFWRSQPVVHIVCSQAPEKPDVH